MYMIEATYAIIFCVTYIYIYMYVYIVNPANKYCRDAPYNQSLRN